MLLERLSNPQMSASGRASELKWLLRGEKTYVRTPDLYLVSFSRARDLLSQWRGYTRYGNGYMLHLSEAAVAEALAPDQQLLECTYPTQLEDVDLKGLDDLLRGEPESFYQLNEYFGTDPKDPHVPPAGTLRKVLPLETHMSSAMARALELMATSKHPSFAEEQEWRIVAHVDKSDPAVSVRPSENGLVDFVTVPLPSSVLTGVTVGPGVHQARQVQVVRRLFPDLSWDRIFVSQSALRQ